MSGPLKCRFAACAAAAAMLACAPGPALADAAIAYNPDTGKWGYSFGQRSTSEADRRAIKECGKGCYAVEWVRGACAALASKRGNPKWFKTVTQRRTQWDAIQAALAACGAECEVRAWVCDDEPRQPK